MTSATREGYWHSVPPAAVPALRPELPALADEIIAAIEGMPGFDPLEGAFQDVRRGVEQALWQFAEMAERPDAEYAANWQLYSELGRAEARAGRHLDNLLAAYRLGARVAWRRLSGAGEAAGLQPRVLYGLAEAIFAYVDEVSAATMQGYAGEQAAVAGERQRRRRRLVRLLIADPVTPPAGVQAAAGEARWPLPRLLAAVAVEGDADAIARRLDPDVLVAPAPGFTCVILPDPDGPGRRRKLALALDSHRAAIGPALGWHEARRSFARARETLRLAGEGHLPASGVLDASEHAVELLLHAAPDLAAEIVERALFPLSATSGHKREALIDTLHAWLRCHGRTEEVAAALHCHPQTVRYRLARLRELFGPSLDDPEVRFELGLALRLTRGRG